MSRSRAARLPARKSSGSLSAAIAVALGSIVLPWAVTPAEAHPHIWVSVRTSVVYANGTITGLRHAWTFDQYYSVMAIEGLDANKDGKYSREELAELAKVNVEALKEFAYFTFPKLKGQELAVGAPIDYHLEHAMRAPTAEEAAAASSASAPAETGQAGAPAPRSGAAEIAAAAAKPVGELTLTFTLPLAKPVLADAQGFSFSVGDSSFFIAFEPARDTPAILGAGAPKGCKVISATPPTPQANTSRPGDLMAGQPSDLSINFATAPVWEVTCAPAG